jgi:hypothetical protein
LLHNDRAATEGGPASSRGDRQAPVETETVIRYGLTKTGKRGPAAGLQKDPGNYGQWQFASR